MRKGVKPSASFFYESNLGLSPQKLPIEGDSLRPLLTARIANTSQTPMQAGPSKAPSRFEGPFVAHGCLVVSHCFLNLSRKSLEAADLVILLMPVPRVFWESNLRTGVGYCVWNTRSQTPLVMP
jgi:hypothetical protein